MRKDTTTTHAPLALLVALMLWPTLGWCDCQDYADRYRNAGELLDDLYLIRDSLISHGDLAIAGGELQDIIRLVETFGFFLVRLDISALVVVGEAGPVHAGAVLEGSWGEESRHVETQEQAIALLRAEATADDVVLVAGADALVDAVAAALGGAA